MSYQDIDFQVIDYNLVALPNAGIRIRGPLPSNLEAGGYICALGAAQTFGRFAERPFLSLVGESIQAETLNLGWAGAGPAQYVSRSKVLEAINRASLAIVQVMSGRSVSNSYFENTGAGSLRPWSAPPGQTPRHAEIEYTELFEREGEAVIRALVAETRERYIDEFATLLGAIKVPKILFWFSERSPDYLEFYRRGGDRSAGGFLGHFPQLVNAQMLEQLKPHADQYVECISARGLPQPTRSRFTGELVDLGVAPRFPGHNNYYPSPEMHLDAAAALVPAVRQLLDRRSS